MLAYNLCKTFLFKHKGYFVKRRSCEVLYNVLLTDITEACYLLGHILRNFHFTSANENIGLDTEGKEFLYTVLCGLCLHLVTAGDERQECNVDIYNVFSSNI